MSRFYDTSEIGGPREITSLYAAKHGYLRPGDRVTYENPYLGPAGMEGIHVITELIDIGDPDHTVTAILDDGNYEVSVDNLVRVEGRHRANGNGQVWTGPLGSDVSRAGG